MIAAFVSSPKVSLILQLIGGDEQVRINAHRIEEGRTRVSRRYQR